MPASSPIHHAAHITQAWEKSSHLKIDAVQSQPHIPSHQIDRQSSALFTLHIRRLRMHPTARCCSGGYPTAGPFGHQPLLDIQCWSATCSLSFTHGPFVFLKSPMSIALGLCMGSYTIVSVQCQCDRVYNIGALHTYPFGPLLIARRPLITPSCSILD